MQFTAEEVAPSTLENLEGAASEGADLIGVEVDQSPEAIVAAINAFVAKPPEASPPDVEVDNWDDRALPLGSLWGQQMVRKFGWRWANVTFHEQGGSKAFGVLAPDRSLVIYPFHFLFGCLENQAPVTVLLAFHMLAAGTIPAPGPDSFVNLMDGVHHIVPPA